MGMIGFRGRAATIVRPGLFISYRLGGKIEPELEKVCLRNEITPVDEDFIENIHRLYSQLRKQDPSVSGFKQHKTDKETGKETSKWIRVSRPARTPHYHSFNAYFNWIKRLAWVEETRKEIIEIGMVPQFSGGRWLERTKPEERPIRIYYQITPEGLEAPLELWGNPKKVGAPVIAKVVTPMPAKVVAPIPEIDEIDEIDVRRIMKKEEILQLLELIKGIQGLIEEKKYSQAQHPCQMLYYQIRNTRAIIEGALPDMTDEAFEEAENWLIILEKAGKAANFLSWQADLPSGLKPIERAQREALLLATTKEIKEHLLSLAIL